MNTLITAEIIPISKFPLQGTVIGEIFFINKKSIGIKISTLLSSFIKEGDEVPLVIRAHIADIGESDCEIRINHIEDERDYVFLNSTFINESEPGEEIINEFKSENMAFSVLNSYEQRFKLS